MEDQVVTFGILGLVIVFVLAAVGSALARRIKTFRRTQARWKQRQLKRRTM